MAIVPALFVSSSSRRRRRKKKKMSFTMRSVKVPPNSVTLEEARSRVFDFFKKACRSLPTVMEIYTLHDVVTISQLRSSVAKEIRMEELNNIIEHAKQRHHLIGQYVVGRGGLLKELDKKDPGSSDFLKRFYENNYF